MRPTVSGDGMAPLSRKSSMTHSQTATLNPPARPGQATETKYFIADERSLEAAALDASPSSSSSPQIAPQGTPYGIQSLADTVGAASSIRHHDDDDDNHRRPGGDLNDKGATDRVQTSPPSATGPLRNIRVSELQAAFAKAESRSPTAQSNATHVFTPLLPSSPAPELSLPSSPRSFSSKSIRQEDSDSVADEAASQAIASSEEDELDMPAEVQDSAPQLIMPSIKMPSRRPFTERGKAMGRLKVLIAGACGTGKTSLIKSIVQALEDIVHVDPLSSSPPSVGTSERRKSSARNASAESSSTTDVTEVFASTKPYPAWWSELDESRVLRRRKSLGDSVLERNLCFVDTPGYSKETSPSDAIDMIVGYVEAQLQRTGSIDQMTDGDLTNLLSGNGGSQVDAVFLLISHRLRSSDLELLRRLSPLTNVIPLISKGDLLSRDKAVSLKASILQKLRTEDLQPFLFGRSVEEILRTEIPGPPFAVSSATANDSENMDASLLMSADYVQPLIPSELDALIDRVFDRDGIAWLRHSAAKKFANWRNRQHAQISAPHIPPLPSLLSSSAYVGTAGSMSRSASTSSSAFGTFSPTSSKVIVPPMGATSSYALARVADHRQREEKLAQVRLAKWASDLQRSLQNERERFEALARGERAIWLTERLGECVTDGTLVPVRPDGGLALSRPSPGLKPLAEVKRWTVEDPRDPLGLLRYNEELKQRGWLALQIVGGLGVIGGLAFWIARNWHTISGDVANWRWHC